MRVCEGGGCVFGGLEVGEALGDVSLTRSCESNGRSLEGVWKAYISQNMRQPRWFLPFPPRLISASVFCVFLAEVQKDFVVGEECGLRGFDLSILSANESQDDATKGS